MLGFSVDDLCSGILDLDLVVASSAMMRVAMGVLVAIVLAVVLRTTTTTTGGGRAGNQCKKVMQLLMVGVALGHVRAFAAWMRIAITVVTMVAIRLVLSRCRGSSILCLLSPLSLLHVQVFTAVKAREGIAVGIVSTCIAVE